MLMVVLVTLLQIEPLLAAYRTSGKMQSFLIGPPPHQPPNPFLGQVQEHQPHDETANGKVGIGDPTAQHKGEAEKATPAMGMTTPANVSRLRRVIGKPKTAASTISSRSRPGRCLSSGTGEENR
jgi:hypothetical protein